MLREGEDGVEEEVLLMMRGERWVEAEKGASANVGLTVVHWRQQGIVTYRISPVSSCFCLENFSAISFMAKEHHISEADIIVTNLIV